MDRKRLFDDLRPLFGGSYDAGEISGLDTILDEGLKRKTPFEHLAYMLATAFHEVAGTMQPIREFGGPKYFFRMYDKAGSRPQVAKRLGNTQPGDGAKFHGRGYVQLTGRANYERAGRKLGLDLVNNPERVMEVGIATPIMFDGMTEGWFTSKKLSHYIGGGRADYRNARRIINGTDKAALIAGYAGKFASALVKAGYPH